MADNKDTTFKGYSETKLIYSFIVFEKGCFCNSEEWLWKVNHPSSCSECLFLVAVAWLKYAWKLDIDGHLLVGLFHIKTTMF